MTTVNLGEYDQSWYKRGRTSIIVALWWLVQGTIFRYSLHNAYNFRATLLKIFGAKIGKNVKVRAKAEFTYPWKVEIGDNVWIDNEVIIYSLDKVSIGNNVAISRRSFLCTGSHDIQDPKFGLMIKPIEIYDGVWIQADCFIGQGIKIGRNSVVLARSSVFKDLPNDMICAGNPCKQIKQRIINDK